MIDIKKKYRTRDGREVRIYATDGAGDYCVQGAAKDSKGWSIMKWTSYGGMSNQFQSPSDLLEVVMLPEYWVVFYDCDNHPRITSCEPDPKSGRTIIHHPAQQKPVT